jgi:CRISPR/Cas system-associated exonuclease Cas4 (RecB family)
MKKHLNFYRGTIINYYFVCHTKLWLFVNRLNLEDNSEDVRIGKVLHEIREDKVDEVSVENIKIDKITKDYVIEVKKSVVAKFSKVEKEGKDYFFPPFGVQFPLPFPDGLPVVLGIFGAQFFVFAIFFSF